MNKIQSSWLFLSERWEALSDWWNKIVCHLPYWTRVTGHLTFGLVLVNILTFMGLHSDHDWYNPYTSYLLVLTFLCLLFVMLYGTEGWSFRSVGVLFLVIGDIFIYGPLAAYYQHIDIDELVRLAVARAFFVVGSVFALYGVLQWVRSRRRRRKSNEGPTVLTREEIID